MSAHIQGFTAKTGLYSDATSPGDSGWQDGSSIAAPYTVEVVGLVAGDHVQVRASNQFDRPSTSDVGVQVGSDVTADGFVVVAAPYRWIRVIRTNKAGAGSVSARFFGHRPPMS